MAGEVGGANLFDRLGAARAGLSPSERRVADIVLGDPDSVPRKNLAALAQEAAVSEPTVLRFCRSLGLEGYADFKIALAAALAAGGIAYVHRDVSFGDDVSVVRSKIVQSSMSALAGLQNTLDDSALEEAAARIGAARRIALFAVGLANTVSNDAQHKFMRIGLAPEALHDTHLQTMSAATLTKGDVALVFSYNGRIKDIVRCAKVARQGGAHVIGVTRTGSPLAEELDLLIAVDTPEDTFLYAPMTTRLSHFVVVDLLATLVALARGPEVVATTEHIKESLSDQWITEASPARRRQRLAASP